MNHRNKKIAEALVDWYKEVSIPYPWRQTKDPYRVWLSEILLQQTRIPVALPFYQKIVVKYPALQDLADADRESFVAEWSGIGYYRRARSMHDCAKVLQENYSGRFPKDRSELLKLPGIGNYTAGAIRNLCFNELTPAVDGNIARVLSRIHKIADQAGSRLFARQIEGAFVELGAGLPASDYFQSLMELGERICLPRPVCTQCPIRKYCTAYSEGIQLEIPKMRAKRQQQKLYWYPLVLSKQDKHAFAQNPERAFLKEAWLFPDILAQSQLSNPEIIERFSLQWGIRISEICRAGTLTHTVTFRKLSVEVLISSEFECNDRVLWLNREELRRYPTTSLVSKIFKSCALTA